MGNLYLRRGDGYMRTYTYPIARVTHRGPLKPRKLRDPLPPFLSPFHGSEKCGKSSLALEVARGRKREEQEYRRVLKASANAQGARTRGETQGCKALEGGGEGKRRKKQKRREGATVNMEDRMKETRQDVLEAHFTQSSSRR